MRVRVSNIQLGIKSLGACIALGFGFNDILVVDDWRLEENNQLDTLLDDEGN